MVDFDAGLAATQALTQQRVALGMIKQASDMEKKMADILATTVLPSGRGQTVDTQV